MSTAPEVAITAEALVESLSECSLGHVHLPEGGPWTTELSLDPEPLLPLDPSGTRTDSAAEQEGEYLCTSWTDSRLSSMTLRALFGLAACIFVEH